ncbi:MAG: glycosyltransferase [Candidatus Neomarinimicrobiota bacterium]|jgi:glycosyltransferase involved in cell wall biosynthesis
MSNKPTISVIIPCRNEEKYIGQCLDSLLRQKYDINNVEILIIDGMSTDNTRNIIKNFIKEYPNIKLFDNPGKTVPYALNIGIANSKNDYIIRMDAHCKYEKSYISELIRWSKQLDADNVGGRFITIPGSESIIAKCISVVSKHSFGIGNSLYRIGLSDVKEVDTVPFGCFKRELFGKIGLFDTDLPRNQDDEFNARIRKNGGKIYLIPSIKIIYYARTSFKKLAIMYYQYGYFKPLAVKKVRGSITIRQLVPAIFVLSLLTSGILSFFSQYIFGVFIGILGLYSIANLLISICLAMKENILLVFGLPVAFAILHFSYGIGYLKGFIDFIVLNKHKKKKIKDINISR